MLLDMAAQLTLWGTLLRGILTRKNMTLRQFGELVGYAFQGVHGAMSGTRRPPKKWVAPWADALHLPKKERAEFIRIGMLMHAPRQIQEEFLALEQEVETLRLELAKQTAIAAAASDMLREYTGGSKKMMTEFADRLKQAGSEN
jgi:hypothetical protein